MFNTEQFWKKRFLQYLKESRSYLKYMFNDHLVIVMIFLLSGLALTYQNWLQVVPTTFPYAVLMGIILALLLTRGGIRTFLKEPDIVFLLPLEEKLKPYIKKSFLFSIALESYFLLIVFGVSVPLYLKVTGAASQSVLVILIMLIGVKSWNLWMSWIMGFYTDKRVRYYDHGIRLIINFTLFYLLFTGANLTFIIAVMIIMLLMLVYFQQTIKNMTWKWEYLINEETKRAQLFYRVANLFVDVPGLKEKVKRRKWLDSILSIISYKQDNSYLYLYTRTFLRSGDYFGLFLRLLVIGVVLLNFLPVGYGTYIVPLFVLYLTAFQLVPMWRYHYNKLWLNLYPLSKEQQYKSFLSLLLSVLIVQTFILSLIVAITATFTHFIIVLIGGIAFSYLYVQYSAKKRVQSI
ncbi:ABC transporter permease [Sutcliffiella cohnii]